MEGEGICLGCMAEKGTARVCPACGYKEGTPPESPLHLKPGTVLNRKYLIGRALGHGGFGITYLGLDMNLRVKLAIKEYFPTGLVTRDATAETVSVFSGDSRESFNYGLEKFLEEGRTLAKFSNVPEIVGVRDFLRENGTAYLVMDYIEGITLKEYLSRQGGKLPLDAALTLVMPVVHALEKVHAAGMLHRDVSPDNIFVTGDFHVKLLDFGAARCAVGGQSRSLSVMLKPGYSPEEQYRSRGKQGPWTDVYATAATLYKLLTGETPPEAMDRLAEDDLTPLSAFGLSLPESYEKVLRKALSVRAGERYQAMAEFEAALTGEIEEDAETKPKPAAVKPVPQSRTEPLGVTVPVLKSTSPADITGPVMDVTVPMPKKRKPEADSAENKPVLFMHHLEDEDEFQAKSAPSSSGKKRGPFAVAAALAVIVIVAVASAAIGHQQPVSVPAQAKVSSEVPGRSSSEGTASSDAPADSSGTPSSATEAPVSSVAHDYAPGQENAVGNTGGNITAAGYAAQQGDWIYYSNGGDGGKLYKIKTDGSGKTKLNEGNSFYINIMGDWVYYANVSDEKIYKIKTDGSGKTLLCQDRAEGINVVGDWIYYESGSSFHMKLYKIKTDGTGRTQLGSDNVGGVNVAGDWIYYENYGDGHSLSDRLYKMKTDGTGGTEMSADNAVSLNVMDGWIYYVNLSDGDSPYKIRTDGTGRIKLGEDNTGEINSTGGWIYYRNDSDNHALYKIKTDGTGRTKLNDGWASSICVAGGWIYYQGDDKNFCRIRTDGTQRQLVN